ncbi:MAG TPA: hypothetical protein DEQ28_04695 [Clostridiales bacterium]|nr:hypothetical protein [Clostridiales bacterium]
MRPMRRTALFLVPILLILSAGPVLAEGTPPADPQLEAARQLLTEMEATLKGALAHAQGGEPDLAVAGVGSYLVLLRQLDGMLPAAEQPAGEPSEESRRETRRAKQALRALTRALQQHGRLLGQTIAALPVEARNQVIELFRVEQAAGYRHAAIAQLVARVAGQTVRRIRERDRDLEGALERAKNHLAKVTEAVARVEARIAELEARIPEITDPARKALAEKRLELARLDLEIARKTVVRFKLLIEILETRLAEQAD